MINFPGYATFSLRPRADRRNEMQLQARFPQRGGQGRTLILVVDNKQSPATPSEGVKWPVVPGRVIGEGEAAVVMTALCLPLEQASKQELGRLEAAFGRPRQERRQKEKRPPSGRFVVLA